MKKLFTLLTMLIVGIGSMWATVDTQIIKVSTSTSDPEHVYFMHGLNSDCHFATQETYASNTAANAAKFAFFQATDANGNVIYNTFFIYCVNNSKWMSYAKQDSYSKGKSFVTMTTEDKNSANYFYVEYVSMTASSVSGTKAYIIHPYKTSGRANLCLNWYKGVAENTETSIGLYDKGVDDAGSGWAFIEAPRIGRYYRIKSCATNKYLATNSTTEDTDNTTLYCYTDKGLAQVSSGMYYNSYSKAVGTTQYTAKIQFNLNASRGAFQFATNGYWTYCKNDGGLDKGTTMNTDENYAWDFEEEDGPIAFVPTLNDIRDAKWYNLKVRGKYITYNATPNSYDGNFYDTEESAPSPSDKSSWFTFVGDPFKGFKIICFADAAAFCSNDVNTNTRIYAGRPENANDYVFEILSMDNELAWQIRDKRGDNAFLNQQAGALGIWNNNARPDIGNRFVITEVEDAEAEYFVTYNIIATDENGKNEISWSYYRLYGTGQTMGETPVDLPFVSNYSCDDPTLSGPVCNLTYTATHTMPFIPATSFASAKPYFMKQRKNDEGSDPKNGYAYYDPARTTNGMPKTKTIGATENYLWKFVGNPYDGYKIYNKAKGDDQGLYMTMAGSSLTWNGTPSAFTLHTMSTSDPNQVVTDGAASTYFKLKGSANNCLHDLSNVLNNWNSSGSVTDAGSIIGFYEAEEYNIVVSGADNGRIIINGTEYANGSKYFNMKGESFTPSVKPISNYQAHEISISGNTISVEYYEVDEYEIEITGGGGNGRIIINDVEYANSQMFYNPKDAEFTPSAKIISYYHAGDISISGNTISLEYTEITVPGGYNGFIAGKTNINADDWKTKEYWCLASGASWNVGPGYHDSGMWQPIYLKGVTATGIQLEGWAFSADLINSSLTAKTTKIQSDWTINVAEDSELELTMTSSYSHPDDGTHTFNINGNMTINAKPNRFNGINVSDNRVNIGENGHFELISSSNLSINNSASFTINVTPTEPTNYNEVLSQETPFAVIQNVTFADGKLTFGKIDPNNKWTKVDEDALLHQTVPGNYYSIVETTETGTKKYYLHTYKYNSIYSRNVSSGNFGSICIPNAVAEIDGIEKVLAVTKVGTDRVEMDEVDVDDMVAGVPYIFKSNKNTISLTVTGESVANPVNNKQTYLVGNFGTPVYVPMSDENNSYYVLQSNQFKKVTSANSIKSGSNRCYLKVSATSQSRLSTLGISVDEDGATGIDALNALINNNAEIYDINGRKLKDLRKGINIVNGVKVLVK